MLTRGSDGVHAGVSPEGEGEGTGHEVRQEYHTDTDVGAIHDDAVTEVGQGKGRQGGGE